MTSRKHRPMDVFYITIACGILGAIAHSSAVFTVTWVICLILWIVGGSVVRSEPTNKSEGAKPHNN